MKPPHLIGFDNLSEALLQEFKKVSIYKSQLPHPRPKGRGSQKKKGKALEEVFREAKAIVESELSRLFSYSPRYKVMLKATALGYSRWRDVRDYVTLKLGYINDSNFSKLLENLVKSGYVEKKGCRYYIFDPVIERIFRGVACSSR